jgi:hypothetical protein
MTSTLRRVVLWSLALLVGGASIATVAAGAEHGAGLLAGGTVVLLGLGLSAFLSRVWLSDPLSLGGALCKLALAVKLPLVVLAIGGLFTVFPVLSVVIGASVLVVAIVVDALGGARSARRVEA